MLAHTSVHKQAGRLRRAAVQEPRLIEWWGRGVLFIWGEVKEFIDGGGELIGPVNAGVNQCFLGFKSVGVKVYGLEKMN